MKLYGNYSDFKKSYSTSKPHKIPRKRNQRLKKFKMEKENIQKTLMTHHFEISVRMLGPESVQINCQHCRSYVTTLTESNIKQRYLVGWCICCIGLWIPCFWCCLPCLPCMAAIPCCKKEFKVITHTCPNCGKVIGKYNGFDLA